VRPRRLRRLQLPVASKSRVPRSLPATMMIGGCDQALGLSIPCIVSQLTKASNQPVLVVSLGYIPKP